MLGMLRHRVVGISVMQRMLIRLHLVMLVRGRMLRLSTVMYVCAGGRPKLVHEARRSVAGGQRHARREHAEQIEQGGKPPRFDALPSRQANEHGGTLTSVAGSAKPERGWLCRTLQHRSSAARPICAEKHFRGENPV